MKRLLTAVLAILLTGFAANAQLAVVGGFTSSKTSLDTKDLMSNINNVSLYHAGVGYFINVAGLVALQPTLSYQVKGANLGQTVSGGTYSEMAKSFSKTGYIELSLPIMLGPDLIFLRPYFLAEPFIGYAVTGTESFTTLDQATINSFKNKLEYGFGVGGGIILLEHFQLNVQWFQNFGTLYNNGSINAAAIADDVKTYYKDIKNYQGIKVTLGFIF